MLIAYRGVFANNKNRTKSHQTDNENSIKHYKSLKFKEDF